MEYIGLCTHIDVARYTYRRKYIGEKGITVGSYGAGRRPCLKMPVEHKFKLYVLLVIPGVSARSCDSKETT